MEMVTFPWGDRSRPLAKRIEILCNLMALNRLSADAIFADAKTRAKGKRNNAGQRDLLASCGCYNTTPWPCTHLYCSCVPLSGTTHTSADKGEYFTAALARLIRETPNAEIDALFREAKSAALTSRKKERWFR